MASGQNGLLGCCYVAALIHVDSSERNEIAACSVDIRPKSLLKTNKLFIPVVFVIVKK